ncbi:hypothetical protein V495_03424 [Pseudogymnoascus sp. VKM F-4514 (FW-929)]|nr:hypothetical protein V495_03424 [Pseudogymnoascus sp. VKM F-4514 (FW-929)]KFY58898.1 hypothetical protein V497_04614 [Pseudogymnoascus sp. VKM F-4516 (FW-969)]
MSSNGHNEVPMGHMVFRIGSPGQQRGIDGSSTPSTTKVYHVRKPHSKSRNGCLPCKAARVKCDEVTPCHRCQDKNIPCQYPKPTSSLLSKNRKAAIQKSEIKNHVAVFQSIPAPLWPGEKSPLVLTVSGHESQYGNGDDLRLLHHFQTFTGRELGSPAFDGVGENVVLDLALEHSHLMHAVLAVGATQLRRLDTSNRHIRLAEMKHWQGALSPFRTALNNPLTRDNCDAILMSSILLNLMAFAFISESDLSPSKSWVFSSSPDTLNWLYIQLGLRHLLEQTKAFHVESRLIPIFLASDDDRGTFSDESPGINGLPERFVKVCGLNESSRPENSPYHSALRLLTPLLTLERCSKNMFKYLH